MANIKCVQYLLIFVTWSQHHKRCIDNGCKILSMDPILAERMAHEEPGFYVLVSLFQGEWLMVDMVLDFLGPQSECIQFGWLRTRRCEVPLCDRAWTLFSYLIPLYIKATSVVEGTNAARDTQLSGSQYSLRSSHRVGNRI